MWFDSRMRSSSDTDSNPRSNIPVHGAGQGQPVLHDVRPLGLDRLDVRRFDLRSAAAIDELKPRECTSPVIGFEDPVRNTDRVPCAGEHLHPILFEFYGACCSATAGQSISDLVRGSNSS